MQYNIFKGATSMIENYKSHGDESINMGEKISGKDCPEYLRHFVTDDAGEGAYCYLDVVRQPVSGGFRYFVKNLDNTLRYIISDLKDVYLKVTDSDGDIIWYEDETVIDKRGPEAGVYWRVIEFKDETRKIVRKQFIDSRKIVTYRNGEVKTFDEYDEEY